MDSTVALYGLYIAAIILDLIAGYFKIIDTTVVASTFTLIVGHFLGLQVIPPSIRDKIEIAQNPTIPPGVMP